MIYHIGFHKLLAIRASKPMVRWLSSHVINLKTIILPCDYLKSHRFLIHHRKFNQFSHYGDPYKILGVTPQSTQNEIKQKFYEKSKKLHPDNLSSTKADNEEFLKIKEAYDLLSSKKSRLTYDQYSKSPERQRHSYDDWVQYQRQSSSRRAYGNVNTEGSYGFKYETGAATASPRSSKLLLDLGVLFAVAAVIVYIVRNEIKMTNLGYGTITNEIRGLRRRTTDLRDERLMQQHLYTQRSHNNNNNNGHTQRGVVNSKTFKERPEKKKQRKKKPKKKDKLKTENEADASANVKDTTKHFYNNISNLYQSSIPTVILNIPLNPSLVAPASALDAEFSAPRTCRGLHGGISESSGEDPTKETLIFKLSSLYDKGGDEIMLNSLLTNETEQLISEKIEKHKLSPGGGGDIVLVGDSKGFESSHGKPLCIDTVLENTLICTDEAGETNTVCSVINISDLKTW